MVTVAGDDAELAASVLRAGALDYVVKDSALAFLGELPKRVVESVTRHRLEQMNRLLIQALESARDGVIITDLQGHHPQRQPGPGAHDRLQPAGAARPDAAPVQERRRTRRSSTPPCGTPSWPATAGRAS